MKASKTYRFLAAAVVGVALTAGLPLAVAGPASAKSCKWVQVSYDPATGVGVVACVGGNRP